MDQQLPYGNSGQVKLELGEHAWYDAFGRPPAEPLDDPVAAVAAAVSDPLDFPSLARATVPGDQIVIAVDSGVPQIAAVVAGIVHCLSEGGAEPSCVTLVERRACNSDPSPLALLTEAQRSAIRCEVHDPHDHSRLSYLAASQEGKPIYLSRTICDADIVIPVCAQRCDASPGFAGAHAGVFPAFSDQETLARFEVPRSRDWQAERDRRRSAADEAAWLLGAQFMVQVIPGPGDSILQVVAGDAETVARRAGEFSKAAWRFAPTRRAPLVVAAIQGGSQQQTWDNVTRALHAAQQVVEDEGVIVICSDLAEHPGPAMQKLMGHDDPELLSREMDEDPSSDAVPALLLADYCQSNRVYLLSQLSEEIVESLGLAYVEHASEITRLSRQFDGCIMLENAHRVIPAVSMSAEF